MREGASGTYETQPSIRSIETVYAHQKEKQDLSSSKTVRELVASRVVCRCAGLPCFALGLSARPKDADADAAAVRLCCAVAVAVAVAVAAHARARTPKGTPKGTPKETSRLFALPVRSNRCWAGPRQARPASRWTRLAALTLSTPRAKATANHRPALPACTSLFLGQPWSQAPGLQAAPLPLSLSFSFFSTPLHVEALVLLFTETTDLQHVQEPG